MTIKNLIFDSGPLINFSMNGILDILIRLKDQFEGDFLITKEVKEEIIEKPLTIKKFELEAIRLKELFEQGIIKYADINQNQINELRNIREEITNLANSTFKINGKNIHIIDKGEAAALALSKILKEPSVLVIDERTTRMLCEDPEKLRTILQKKLKAKVEAKKQNYEYFKNFRIIRSTELIYIAHKKSLIHIKDPRAYEAILYSLKTKGCSISEEEIEAIKKI
jgi:hypothetical protein